MILIKRVYEKKEEKDGFRILIDRIWPRGVSKEKAKINLWLKEIAPSNELRKWFHHDENRWSEFKKRYREELKDREDLTDQIKELEYKYKIITFIYSAKNVAQNQAVILKEYLEKS